VRRVDPVSVIAGLAVCGLGVLLLLDRTDALNLHFDYAGPAALAAVGLVLLAMGLSRD
jgi:hypothetical protein